MNSRDKKKDSSLRIGFLGFLIFATAFSSCSKRDFEISSNAHDFMHVKNGDYNIPVLVRGNTAGKKILLYIQGGPVINSLDFAEVDYPGWKSSLEKSYAVAYYDQRGTGNLNGNFSQGQSVLTTWIDDLHKVAAFLQKAYDADVIMLGHSFGGLLMYRYMIDKGTDAIPVKFISVSSPVTTDADTDTLRWKFRREFLLNTANLQISRGVKLNEWNQVLSWLSVTPAIKKINGNDPYQLFKQWNQYVEELVYSTYPQKEVKARDYLNIIFSSSYNPLPAFLKGNYRDELITRILLEEEQNDLMPMLPLINYQSLLMITGRYDDICVPEELTYAYNKISSPNKRMKIIDYSGHYPFIDQPTQFNQEVKLFLQ
jgi:pimeloyl-ACP methyl ester carboxylesterase